MTTSLRSQRFCGFIFYRRDAGIIATALLRPLNFFYCSQCPVTDNWALNGRNLCQAVAFNNFC